MPEVRPAYMLVRRGELGIESVTDSCTTHTIEDELAIAHRALGEGDLGHAAFHIATALATDPSSAEAVAVFDGWFAACDNALGLVTKRENEHWEGWFAMRARTYAKLGRSENALPLLAKLAAAAPEKAYLSWLPLLPNPGYVSDEAAEALTSVLLPALSPNALGDWWILGSIVGLGVAFLGLDQRRAAATARLGLVTELSTRM